MLALDFRKRMHVPSPMEYCGSAASCARANLASRLPTVVATLDRQWKLALCHATPGDNRVACHTSTSSFLRK
ncbi:hypothetical protein ACP70R_038161 [Stipagrostis hirtigluma subsp. patula]